MLLDSLNVRHCSDAMFRIDVIYNFTHFMFKSKVCQLLCHLHAISIEMPEGPGVTQSEKPNMLVNRITAHIQHGDKCFHWGDSLIGQGTLCLVVPEDRFYNSHLCFMWACRSEPGSCDVVSLKTRRERQIM